MGLVVLFFSLSSGKRGVYILPALPAVALASAPYLIELTQRRAVQRAMIDRQQLIQHFGAQQGLAAIRTLHSGRALAPLLLLAGPIAAEIAEQALVAHARNSPAPASGDASSTITSQSLRAAPDRRRRATIGGCVSQYEPYGQSALHRVLQVVMRTFAVGTFFGVHVRMYWAAAVLMPVIFLRWIAPSTT